MEPHLSLVIGVIIKASGEYCLVISPEGTEPKLAAGELFLALRLDLPSSGATRAQRHQALQLLEVMRRMADHRLGTRRIDQKDSRVQELQELLQKKGPEHFGALVWHRARASYSHNANGNSPPNFFEHVLRVVNGDGYHVNVSGDSMVVLRHPKHPPLVLPHPKLSSDGQEIRRYYNVPEPCHPTSWRIEIAAQLTADADLKERAVWQQPPEAIIKGQLSSA